MSRPVIPTLDVDNQKPKYSQNRGNRSPSPFSGVSFPQPLPPVTSFFLSTDNTSGAPSDTQNSEIPRPEMARTELIDKRGKALASCPELPDGVADSEPSDTLDPSNYRVPGTSRAVMVKGPEVLASTPGSSLSNTRKRAFQSLQADLGKSFDFPPRKKRSFSVSGRPSYAPESSAIPPISPSVMSFLPQLAHVHQVRQRRARDFEPISRSSVSQGNSNTDTAQLLPRPPRNFSRGSKALSTTPSLYADYDPWIRTTMRQPESPSQETLCPSVSCMRCTGSKGYLSN